MENGNLLTVGEAANLLRLHPRTVMTLVRRGEIPGSKIGRQWRFKRSTIDQWLATRLGDVPETEPLASFTERQMPDSSQIWGHFVAPLKVACMEYRPRIQGVDAGTQVLSIIARLLAWDGGMGAPDELLQTLLERERMHPTAVSGGIAFPHPRRPVGQLDKAVISALVLGEGIPFGAADGGRTRLFIGFTAPDDTLHVRVLGGLGRLFRGIDINDLLRDCQTPEAIATMLGSLMGLPLNKPAVLEA